jgi:hypothetical protein
VEIVVVEEAAVRVAEVRATEQEGKSQVGKAPETRGEEAVEALGGMVEEVLEETKLAVVVEAVVGEEDRTEGEEQVGHKHRQQAQRRRLRNLAFRRVPARVA